MFHAKVDEPDYGPGTKSIIAESTLYSLREGFGILASGSNNKNSFIRLRSDVGALMKNCSDFWSDLGELGDHADPAGELRIVGASRRRYNIRSTWASEREGFSNEGSELGNDRSLTNRDKAPHAGTAFAASVGTAVSALVHTVAVGTQSVYTTLVQAGAHSVVPQYVLRDGRMMLDHYTVLTAPNSIHGWTPQLVSSLSPLAVPMFSSMFALAYGLDGVHAYMNNQCSSKDALISITRGAFTGAVLGVGYFGTVSLCGLAYAPIVSTSLCILWLLRLFHLNSLSKFDLAIGAIGNITGLTAFLLSGSPLLSMLLSFGGGVVGGGIYTMVSSTWTCRLQKRLVETSSRILSITDSNPSRSQIDSAFRRQARECHPDKRVGTREDFELISIAREILVFDLTQRQERTRTRNDSVLSRIFKGFQHAADTFLVGPMTTKNIVESLPISTQTLSTQFLYSPD